MSQGEREYYGSLLMAREDLPVDRHGFPYQVILLLMPGGGGTRDLKRDVQGRVLAWVRDEQCRPEAVPRVLGNNVGPICMRCRDVRQELDALLD